MGMLQPQPNASRNQAGFTAALSRVLEDVAARTRAVLVIPGKFSPPTNLGEVVRLGAQFRSSFAAEVAALDSAPKVIEAALQTYRSMSGYPPDPIARYFLTGLIVDVLDRAKIIDRRIPPFEAISAWDDLAPLRNKMALGEPRDGSASPQWKDELWNRSSLLHPLTNIIPVYMGATPAEFQQAVSAATRDIRGFEQTSANHIWAALRGLMEITPARLRRE